MDHPQAYTLTGFTLSCPMTNPFDGMPITAPRMIHGFYSKPTAPPPAGGYPIVMALNGHGGTAQSIFTPDDNYFYYGDAYARRGYFVISVDIKHHEIDEVDGEDGFHPAIIGDSFTTSDWEEDGERAWDVRRATDWVFTRKDVDPTRERP